MSWLLIPSKGTHSGKLLLLGHHSISVATRKVWNDVWGCLHNLLTIDAFKTTLEMHLYSIRTCWHFSCCKHTCWLIFLLCYGIYHVHLVLAVLFLILIWQLLHKVTILVILRICNCCKLLVGATFYSVIKSLLFIDDGYTVAKCVCKRKKSIGSYLAGRIV